MVVVDVPAPAARAAKFWAEAQFTLVTEESFKVIYPVGSLDLKEGESLVGDSPVIDEDTLEEAFDEGNSLRSKVVGNFDIILDSWDIKSSGPKVTRLFPVDIDGGPDLYREVEVEPEEAPMMPPLSRLKAWLQS